jgi:hypothetical protein
LVLAYFNAVQPILRTSTALESLFEAMAHANILEALLFSRRHAESTREVLFRRLVTVALQGLKDDVSPSGASELAFLPFDAEEDTWFEQFLTTGDGKNLNKAKDALLIRKIATDRFSEIGKQKAGGHWSAVLEGIKAGTELPKP